MKTKTVELDRILLSGEDADRYDFSHRPKLNELSASILTEGLLVPPVLKERKQGDLQIVCGFRRIRALRLIGSKQVEAVLISEQAGTDADCVRRSILENRWHRGFNEVERARLFTRLHDEFSALLPSLSDILKDDLKLPQDPAALEPYRFILTLAEAVLDGIALGRISLGQALLLKPFGNRTRILLYRLMDECELTLQESRQAAEWMLDMAHTESKGPGLEINEGFLDSPFAEGLPPRHKTKELLSMLRKKRFPLLVSWQERFDSTRKQSGLPAKGIRISHDPTFETTRVRVQFHAESEAEFTQTIDWISQAVLQGEVRRIFQALSVD